MIFTVEQIRSIRQGKMRAVLMPVSERLRVMSVRVLRYRAPVAEDGTPPPRAIEVVTERTSDGEAVAVAITVRGLQEIFGAGDLQLAQAKRCGFRTTSECWDSWTVQHPRALLARLVEFELGDLRDYPRLISAGWPDYTSDPSRAMAGSADPGEGLTSDQLAAMSAGAAQRYLARQARAAQQLAALPPGERLDAINRGSVVSPDD